MEVLLFFIKWGILFGLFILPLARKGVSSGVQCFFIKKSAETLRCRRIAFTFIILHGNFIFY